MRKLILRCGLSPGDIVMMTAAVRDLHHWYPGQFRTDVRTACAELWENNPHLTPLDEDDPEAEQIECRYPLINRANRAPYHCLHGFIEFLNERLGLSIKPTLFKGDIHLTEHEKAWYSQVHEVTGEDTPFWIVAAGGKYDVTIKWWDSARYQEVLNRLRGTVQFVQVGKRGHHHPRLESVIDLRGRTSLRELIRLVYHSQGVLCGVTALMHLAAAVETKAGRQARRPCVVIAGGREPAHWEAYPGHQFIHTNGALRCCANGGCWRDRTVRLRDGDRRDRRVNLCVNAVHRLPRCMDMITVDEVVKRIESYFEGGSSRYLSSRQREAAQRGIAATGDNEFDRQPLNLHSAGMACDQFIQGMGPYPGGHQGRGIVICGGGVRYFTCAWVCINMLRHLGCRLPIQVWHLGIKELNQTMAELLRPLDVECVDASKLRQKWPARILNGWELKAYALLRCCFREVLLLDADNVPVVNPEFLFDTPQFSECGAVFWPDRGMGQDPKTHTIWRSCGLRHRAEREIESGQILVDKPRCWAALHLAMWFNENSDFYYQYIHGDKETFHIAFRKMKQRYALVPRLVHTLPGTMCQHDFEGRRIFQHRNRDKWDLCLCNKRIADFWFEEECRQYLVQLRRLWDGGLSEATRELSKGSNPANRLGRFGSVRALSTADLATQDKGRTENERYRSSLNGLLSPAISSNPDSVGTGLGEGEVPATRLKRPGPGVRELGQSAKLKIQAVLMNCGLNGERGQTLKNLARTDWGESAVEVQAQEGSSEDEANRRLACAYLALKKGLEAGSDYLLLLEDALDFNRHLRHNLERWQPLENGRVTLAGLLNTNIQELACDAPNHARLVAPRSVAGGRAFLVSQSTVRHILRRWNRVTGTHDLRMARLASQLKNPIYYHAPSLVDLSKEGRAHGARSGQAIDFDPSWKA